MTGWQSFEIDLAEHPTDESLSALLERARRPSSAERRRLVDHLDVCAPCRDALLAVAALDGAGLLSAHVTGSPAKLGGG